MAIDTVISFIVCAVIWCIMALLLLAMEKQEQLRYEMMKDALEELEMKIEEVRGNVRTLYDLGTGSVKLTDFQSYYPADWTDIWKMHSQQTEDQTLGETGD